jgi:hypothetical protein
MPKDTRNRTRSARDTAGGELRPEQPKEDAAAHAVGTGAGAGAGAALGGVIGAAVGGPAGAAVGATFGALGGGLGGRAAAEAFNPTEEDAYWRDNYLNRPHADDTLSYDHYRPAYRYGWESRTRHEGRRWDEVERELERGWRENRGTSRLGWGDARLAARDAWQRVDHHMLDQREAREREAALAEGDAEAADNTDTGASGTP